MELLRLVHFSDFNASNSEEGNFNSRPKGLDLMNSNGNVAQLLAVEMLQCVLSILFLGGNQFS